ncbi:MAG: hypothetical protein IKT40_01295 [Bacilli bacterium]|nr:hypothetical protein [Bacilli bacterium]
MERNGLNYSMVNVVSRHGGYSFIVTSKYSDLSDYDIIEICKYKGYFQEEDDYEYAEIDNLVNDYDINHYKEFTYSID